MDDTVTLLARLEGIFLDPLDTGKAMAHLITDIESRRFSQPHPLLFIHTGGVANLFS